jgi:hypothetical protein
MTDENGDGDADTDTEATANGVQARYEETDTERLLAFEYDGQTAAVAQNREGYAMLKVRQSPDGDELERYYGFDMALDHAAELLGVARHDLPVPESAEDMGM